MASKFPNTFAKQISKSQQEKVAVTRLWDLCLLYLEGQQYVSYDRTLQQYATTTTQGRPTKYVINLLINIYRHITSKLSVEYPSISVLPASPSTEDVIKAKSSEEAIKYFWHQNNMKGTIHSAMKWLISCGNAGLHTVYDPSTDTVRVEVVAPYNIYYEPGVRSAEDSRWVAVRTIVPRSDLEAAFPKKKKAISDMVDSTYQIDGPQTQGSNVPLENRIDVYDVYYSDGRYGIYAGNEWLHEGTYPANSKPLVLMQYTDVPFKLWGIGLIANLIDLQSLYNRSRNQIIENVDLMSNPKWLIPKTAGVAQSAIKGKPGEKVYYNSAGGKPEQVSGAALPAHVLANVQQLQNEMLDVAGLHSTSMGKRAVGINSAASINALSQNDSSQLQMTQQDVELAIKDVASSVLLYMREHYGEAKMMRMMDSTGKVVFKAIQGTDLVETPEIFLEAGSLFRDETNDRFQKVIQMLQLGVISKDDAMRELALKTSNKFLLDKIASMSHAQDMLKGVIAGKSIQIFPSDDTETFIEVFQDFMRTEEFYDLEPRIQDNIASYFEEFHAAQGGQAEDMMEREMNKQPSAQQMRNIAAQKQGKLSAPLSPSKPQDVFGAMPTQQGQAGGLTSRRGPQRTQPTPEEVASKRAEALGGGFGGTK